MKRLNLVLLLSAICSSSAIFASNALNFEGYGPVSRSLGGAGVAHNIGAASMMNNPATLALIEANTELTAGFNILFPDVEIENLQTGEIASSGNGSNNRGPYFIPEIAIVHRINAFTFGVGIFAQGGAGVEYGNDSFLSWTTTNDIDTGLEISSRVFNVEIPFSIAYQVNEKLTLGMSYDVIWTAANANFLLDATQIDAYRSDGRVDGSIVPLLDSLPNFSGVHIGILKDEFTGGGVEGWGYGAKFGLTYQISEDTRIGMVYHIKTRVNDLKGKADVAIFYKPLPDPVPAESLYLQGDVAVIDFQSPAQVTIGLSHQLNNHWVVVADYQRAFWSDVLQDFKIAYIDDATGDNIRLKVPQNFSDINVYSVGFEYQPTKKWSYRFGYNKSDQVIPTNMLFDILPANTTAHIMGGFTYQLSDVDRIEFALSHALENKKRNTSLPNTDAPIEVSHSQFNAVVSYVRRF
jgi:long-chain fatty acid transport protein